jgi:1-acyl-sn-glycerol-3-phosphate acyltransferase
MRTTILFVIYVLAIIVLSPVIFLCMIFGFRTPLLAIGRGLLVIGKAVLGIKLEVTGLDRFDSRGQFVFMPNHLSFLDGPLMILVIPQKARVIMKKKVFGLPIVGWAMRHVGYVPVDRKGRDKGRRSIERASRMMRERGYSFLIFPEGTRSLDGKLHALRRGGFFLAIQGGSVPIVPVTIRGALELMPKGRFRARRGTIGVTFHSPISVEGLSVEDIPDLMARVAAVIQSGI